MLNSEHGSIMDEDVEHVEEAVKPNAEVSRYLLHVRMAI